MWPDWVCGALAAAAVCTAAYKKRTLTLGASVLSALLVAAVSVLGSWRAMALLVGAFLAVSAAGVWAGRRAKKPHEQRNAAQVAQNGLAAFLALVFFAATKNRAFLAAYAVAIGEALSDSLASDIGALSPNEPIDILRFRRVPRSASGGISPLGSAAALLGALLVCLPAAALFGLPFWQGLLASACAFLGMLADSVLGSGLQARFRCPACGAITERRAHCGQKTALKKGVSWLDNGMVNLTSNLLAALLAAVLLL